MTVGRRCYDVAMRILATAALSCCCLLVACGGDDDAGLGGVGGASSGGSAGSGGSAAGGGAAAGSAGVAGSGGGSGGGAAGAAAGGGTAGAGGGGAGAGGSAGATGGTAGSPSGGAGGATGGTGGGIVVDSAGCADGQREGYNSVSNFPNIAACAGGFDVAGVKTPASMSPQCNRGAGDDGGNPSGTGCSVADLCGQGWRVCVSGTEVATSAGGAGCTSSNGFWATRQSMSGSNCSLQPTAVNNVVGCGTVGWNFGCAGLNRTIRYDQCPAGWSCGNSSNSQNEATIVTKPLASGGGVLCCRISN